MLMKIPFVDLKLQYKSIKKEIDKAIFNVLENTAFIGGKILTDFEEKFAKIHQAKFCVGVSSGTSALFLALKSLGIGKNDEVITVPNTFIATTEAITQVGAKIKFIDINPNTYNMNVDLLEKAITKKTKAIIPVHLYGQMAEMDKIKKIAKKYKLFVIEDAAQAHLAQYKNHYPGYYSDAACFSFYPGKNLGAYGDAGAIITNNKKLAEKIKMLSNHGRLEKYKHLVEGYNHRLDTLQAAILNVKLTYLTKWTADRRRLAQYYTAQLKNFVETPKENSDFYSVYHLYVIRVHAKKRKQLQESLKKAGIATGIHYPIPLHLQPAYKYLNIKKGSFPITETFAKEILSLPLYPGMTKYQQDYIIKKIINFLKEN